MSAEKSGYAITGAFTPAAGSEIEFKSKAKTPPGLEGMGPIDINTDGSPVLAEQAPADQIKMTPATFTIIYDVALWKTMYDNMLIVGVLVLTSSYSSAIKTIDNCWIQNVSTGSADLDGNPTMDVTIEFGGGAAGVPVIT